MTAIDSGLGVSKLLPTLKPNLEAIDTIDGNADANSTANTNLLSKNEGDLFTHSNDSNSTTGTTSTPNTNSTPNTSSTPNTNATSGTAAPPLDVDKYAPEEDKIDAAVDSINRNTQYDALIEKYAEKYGLDPDLIRCIIQKESGFDPYATSPKGAGGLMQMTPSTANWLGVTNVYDPEDNLSHAIEYLDTLIEMCHGDIALALAAYNAGIGNVERNNYQIPDFKETKEYVATIAAYYKNLTGKDLPSTLIITSDEKNAVEEKLKDAYGDNYEYEITYYSDGTYTYKIFDHGKEITKEEATKGLNKPLDKPQTDLSKDIPDSALEKLPQNTGWQGSFGQAILNNYGNGDGTLDTNRMVSDWVNAGGDAVTYTNNGDGTWSTSYGYSGYAGGVGYYSSYNGYTTGNEDWSWTGFDVFSPGGGWNDPWGTMSFYGNFGGFGGGDMVENGEPPAKNRPDTNCKFMKQDEAQ